MLSSIMCNSDYSADEIVTINHPTFCRDFIYSIKPIYDFSNKEKKLYGS